MKRELFLVGLSRIASNDTGAQNREGRRVLERLDRWAGKILGKDFSSRIAIDAGGRPYFEDRHADFNISHSWGAPRQAGMAAASYLVSPGIQARTGCDIQYIDPRKTHEGIAERFFHPPERDYLAAAPSAERARRFYRLWTLKEAFLKLRGLSVFDLSQCPCFTLPPGKKQKTVPAFFLYELGDDKQGYYSLAVCRNPPEKAPEILWFSPDPPPVAFKPPVAQPPVALKPPPVPLLPFPP
jgi:phosphopantetheinyl transferase